MGFCPSWALWVILSGFSGVGGHVRTLPFVPPSTHVGGLKLMLIGWLVGFLISGARVGFLGGISAVVGHVWALPLVLPSTVWAGWGWLGLAWSHIHVGPGHRVSLGILALVEAGREHFLPCGPDRYSARNR